jgi:hypothetical protein
MDITLAQVVGDNILRISLVLFRVELIRQPVEIMPMIVPSVVKTGPPLLPRYTAAPIVKLPSSAEGVLTDQPRQ